MVKKNVKKNEIRSKNSNFDAWQNILSGLGIAGKDKRTGAIVSDYIFTEHEISNIYSGDDIAKKVVNLIPEEGMRKGYEITNIDKEIDIKIKEDFKKLEVNKKIEQAWKWARLYGGSAILISTSDGEDSDKELNENNIESINALTVLHRYELQALSESVTNEITNKNFGYPELYRLIGQRVDEKIKKEIHYTRLLRFEGSELTIDKFISNGYWHDSVLSQLYNVLRNFNLAHDTLPNIIQEFVIGTLTLNDVASLIAAGENEKVLNRLLAFDMQKRVSRTAILDKEDEYKLHSINITGIEEIMKEINNRLVSSTGMPHTIILGDSPKGGLSGKGESENRDYYDLIVKQQKSIIRKQLERLIKLYMLSKKGATKGKEIEGWGLKFNSLWEMDDKEIVEIRKLQAETDKIYIETGVIDPAEVTESRFAGEAYSIETKIDKEIRERQRELANSKIDITKDAEGVLVNMEDILKHFDNGALQTIIISKTIAKTQDEADYLTKKYGTTKNLKESETNYIYYQITDDKFKPKTSRSFVINPGIVLIYGELK